jgi:hypothetical protein
MAVLSDYHWRDRVQGLRELRRVARRRVVLFNADPAQADLFWLTVDYLPSFLELFPARYRAPGAWQSELEHPLGPVRLVAAPIPGDSRLETSRRVNAGLRVAPVADAARTRRRAKAGASVLGSDDRSG